MAKIDMKAEVDFLQRNPETLSRFCELLAEYATVCSLENEIHKESESLRLQIAAALAIKLGTEGLLIFHRQKTHPRLLMAANAIGRERGQRIGQEAGQRSILEARHYAEVHTAVNAPWLAEAVTEEDGEQDAPKGHPPGVAYH